ncbi:MAG TPA: hypothetical protein VEB42_00965 [Chitinophagaceae bacterium]|nr:hypothetical protein [Chitinophagaceae bacterium]
MKKLVAISLLLIVFFNQLGYYFIHSLQQYQARQEIKRTLLANLPESELEVISAPAEKLQWEEDGKEFYYHGQMYDVVSMKVLHGKTFYYCINDTKEKQLLDQLVRVVRSSNEEGKSTSAKNIIKYMVIDSELPDTGIPLVCLTSKPEYTTFTSQLASSDHEVIPQPPRA